MTGTGTIHQNLIVASNAVVKLDGGTFTVKGSITNNGTIILNNGAQIIGYSSFSGNSVAAKSGLSSQTITFPSISAQTSSNAPVILATNGLVSTIPVINGSFETPGVTVGGPWARFGTSWSISNSPSVFQQVQAVSGGIFTNTPTALGLRSSTTITPRLPLQLLKT